MLLVILFDGFEFDLSIQNAQYTASMYSLLQRYSNCTL